MLEILQEGFMVNAIQAGVLASIIFGIIGTYVVAKKIVFISGGISHASFGGVGLALYLGWNPLIGAFIFALASALGVSFLKMKTKHAEDTTIGIFWALGMAIGAIFYDLTPGNLPSIQSFLFGDILLITNTDIYLLIGLLVGILILIPILYHKIQAVSFDEEFSKVAGLNTMAIHSFLLILIALSITFMIKLVGIILVIAMLTIPASISMKITPKMSRVMMYSSLISIVLMITGLSISYYFDLPAGPPIVIIAGLAFGIGTVLNN